MSRGLLDIESVSRQDVESILARSKTFQPAPGQPFKRTTILQGKSIVNLFFEASTRTRTSRLRDCREATYGCGGFVHHEFELERFEGRVASIYAEHPGRDAATTLLTSCATQHRAHRISCRGTCRCPSSMRATGRTRTSNTSVAGRAYHFGSTGNTRRPAGGHHRRHRP